jgi:hypothetical protein
VKIIFVNLRKKFKNKKEEEQSIKLKNMYKYFVEKYDYLIKTIKVEKCTANCVWIKGKMIRIKSNEGIYFNTYELAYRHTLAKINEDGAWVTEQYGEHISNLQNFYKKNKDPDDQTVLWNEIGAFANEAVSFNWYPEKLQYLLNNYTITKRK